jgi:Zn-dependent peptidase ImmA (M78 family)/transcriptional regulator with XRE-family HTH domain
MTRVAVNPDLFRWARKRSRIEPLVLVARFPQLPAWENAQAQPTLKQLESYARATHAPIGFFFLPEPPQEPLPIPDFRTVAGRPIARPSPNLLDTIYVCQERQSWYREFATVSNQDPLDFVGSLTTRTPPAEASAAISRAVGFDLEMRRDCPTWTEALRRFIDQADKMGALVMVSGVVLNNNRRHLDPEEFRGFAMVDPLAPLVFINGADSKAAQMFTLAHELAHLWIGASALSDSTVGSTPDQAIESWCNRVAAELLVPMAALRASLVPREALVDTLARLARVFKVSTLVILRRLFDAGQVAQTLFRDAYATELRRLADLRQASGGDFYRTTTARVSRRFGRALVESTLEGRTLYRDAFRMLGISKTGTFNEFARRLELAI